MGIQQVSMLKQSLKRIRGTMDGLVFERSNHKASEWINEAGSIVSTHGLWLDPHPLCLYEEQQDEGYERRGGRERRERREEEDSQPTNQPANQPTSQ